MRRRATNREWRSAGFTLVEVLLAIGIVTAILLVALFFYQQAANMRTQLLAESERLASVRLVMDRLTSDLRTVYGTVSGGGVSGDAASLRIVRTELPSRSAWTVDTLERVTPVASDLRRVSYSLGSGRVGTNSIVAGLVRTEESLVAERPSVMAARRAGASETVIEVEPQTPTNREPPTEAIQFLYFRYWDGDAWLESWSQSELPGGIEVSLGAEPLPEEFLPEEYPFEVFRRVISLPAARLNPGTSEISEVGAEDGASSHVVP
jgi:type II secretory pathway pseudopilin PulG